METLKQVDQHAQTIAQGLGESSDIPVRLVCKPVLTTPEAILDLCQEANRARQCIGLMTWMHTFSPAKMWIAGLSALSKPFVHLHTQFNSEIPWSTIDMDFMNLNQSAHGGREFGFLCSRMRLPRKIVVGHWQEPASRASWACGLVPPPPGPMPAPPSFQLPTSFSHSSGFASRLSC